MKVTNNMPQMKINITKHEDTGLLVASSDDMKGFVVHARSDDELYGKLANAFTHYMNAIGSPVSNVEVRRETPAGFWPPTYIARGETGLVAA